jgi:hypothetical protein
VRGGVATALAAAAAIASLILLDASPLRSAAPPAGEEARSLEAYGVMASTLMSPRCQNCHTLSSFPRQGDGRHAHAFNVMRGPDDHGAVGLPCSTCHGRANNAASGVPGAAETWRLAPLGMGWEGLSAAELCRHLKDPAHNGNRSGAEVIAHLKTPLVAWAWSPGRDAHGNARAAPPLSYADFIAAAESWVSAGEACP